MWRFLVPICVCVLCIGCEDPEPRSPRNAAPTEAPEAEAAEAPGATEAATEAEAPNAPERAEEIAEPAAPVPQRFAFERRGQGNGDLFLGTLVDGEVTERAIATSEAREWHATFSADGGTLYYLKSERPGRRVVSDAGSYRGLIRHEPRAALIARDLATDQETTLAERVHWYQNDARGFYYVSRTENRREAGLTQAFKLENGEATKLVDLSDKGVHFCVAEDQGRVVVAEAARHSYRSGYGVHVRLREAGGSDWTSPIEFPDRRWFRISGNQNWVGRRLHAFTVCALAGETLDLGDAVVSLSDGAPTFRAVDRPEGARGAGEEQTYVRGNVTDEECGIDSGGRVHYDFEPNTQRGDVRMFTARANGHSFQTNEPWSLSSQANDSCTPYARTRVVVITSDKIETLTHSSVLSEYAAHIHPTEDRLMRTRVREGVPWLIESKLDGSEERRVVEGQFGIWAPRRQRPISE